MHYIKTSVELAVSEEILRGVLWLPYFDRSKLNKKSLYGTPETSLVPSYK